MTVVVTAYAGEPVSTRLACALCEQGSIRIGRSPGNDLVLDDPARQVSRFQAEMSARPDGVQLSNVSSQSSILVNGLELKPGQSVSVSLGDTLVMGRYQIELEHSALDTSDFVASPLTSTLKQPDPLRMGHSPAAPAFQIPDDYDVFALPTQKKESSDELQVNSLADFHDTQSQSLLEGLDANDPNYENSLLADSSPIGEKLLDQVEEKLDPMQLFSTKDIAETLTPETLALDHTPVLNSLFKLPAQHSAAPFELPPISCSEESTATLPTNEETPVTAQQATVELSQHSHDTAPGDSRDNTPVDMQSSLPDPLSTQELIGNAEQHSLLEALAAGLNLPVEALPPLAPQTLHELGAILKAITDGTVRLMHSRSLAKHEMRANVTIIASAGNNPIKFAPDGTAALQQMLGKRFAGFMPPITAIEDAFDDLTAHQLGLLSGSRRAALHLFEKLDPKHTAADHDPSGILETAFPFLREARLWRRHQRLYRKMADDREALANLIEQDFSRAYEEEIERIYTGRDQ